MKYLAIVPARKGSTRAPGKNTRLLHGKRLIDWTVEFAINVDWIDEVYVSTDIPELIDFYKSDKVICDTIRPSSLCDEMARTEDVVKYILGLYNGRGLEVENIVLLQPTSPFRTISRLEKAKHKFEKRKTDSIVGISKLDQKLSWLLIKQDTYFTRYFPDHKDAQTISYFDGSFFMTSTATFLRTSSFTAEQLVGVYPDHPFESCDIDTENDFLVAKALSKDWV